MLLFMFAFYQRETITLKRGGEKGLGFSIAGGRGSTPYKDSDPVTSFCKVQFYPLLPHQSMTFVVGAILLQLFQ